MAESRVCWIGGEMVGASFYRERAKPNITPDFGVVLPTCPCTCVCVRACSSVGREEVIATGQNKEGRVKRERGGRNVDAKSSALRSEKNQSIWRTMSMKDIPERSLSGKIQ